MKKNQTYNHEITKVLYTGEHGVDVIERVEQDDPVGKYVVRVNGIAQLWYAMPTVAISRAKKYRPNGNGMFGLPVNATGRMC